MYSSQGVSGTGGVIQAHNTTFKNNWNSVDFRPFQNFYYINGSLIHYLYKSNLSRFTNCTFAVDNDYREFDDSYLFQAHMIIAGVDGLNIKGCDFVNENTTTLFQNAEDYGVGIFSIDTDYKVGPIDFLNPQTPADIGRFEGLFEGIRSMNISSNEAPVIERTNFVNNHYGIFNDGVKSLSVTRSNFTIGGFPKARAGSGNIHEGLVNNGGTGFTLEENTFSASSTNPTTAVTVGMRIADTDVNDNQVYLNTYNELFIANLANGINAGIDSIITNPEPGLKYFCNFQNSSSYVDLAVAPNLGQQYASIEESHFLVNNGGASISAANTFENPVYDIWNGYSNTNPLVLYMYSTASPSEDPSPINNVMKTTSDEENNCVSNLVDDPTTIDPTEVEAASTTFFGLQQNYEDELSSWEGQIDNGDTEALLTLVEEANEGNAEDIKDQLLNHAPWCSEKVLTAYVNNLVFSGNQLEEVLELHPDVLRKVTFMNFLMTESNALDQNQLNNLQTVIGNITVRTDLEGKISSYSNQKTYAAQRVIRNMLNDTIEPPIDSLKVWYERIDQLSAYYSVVELYWEHDDLTTAMTYLNGIPSKYTLNTAQQEAYNDYKSFKQILKTVADDNRTIFDLTTAEQTQVSNIANKGVELAHIQAQSLLNFAYNGTYRKEAYIPSLIEAKPIFEEDEVLTEVKDWGLKAVPNPSQNQTVLAYQVGEIEGEPQLIVRNVQGQVVLQKRLQKPSGEVLINTSDWVAGTYYCVITTANERSKVYKLVVVK